MRIRTKKWAKPELAACDYFVDNPLDRKGKWNRFFAKKQPIHLDLGCGKCTFLAELAYRNQDVNYIGVDISYDILGVARRNISERFGDEKVENVALLSYNIEKISDFIDESEKVDRIYINFCNPWQKSRCHKRRLTHTRQLENYKKILSENGEIWFKTDDDNLFLSSLRYFKEAGFEIYEETRDLNSLPNTGNILSEHEVMFESQGIKTKALKARLKKTELIENAMRYCGEIMLKAERTEEMVDEKSGKANFVTTYDKLVQETLKEKLGRIMPEAHFVGEEEDIHESIESGYAFIVDPIDGTTNFIRDYHTSSISVGLLKDGEPVYGAVYNPYLNEMFTAEKGQGAFVNKKPIKVSGNNLENSIVLFGTSPYYPELSKKSFDLAYDYFTKSLDVRRSGSAAIDLCSVASGRADLFFELKLSPWDFAAGSIIITEAGGKITQLDGSPLTFDKPCSVVASNGIVEILN